MGRSMTKKAKIEYFHTWHDNDQGGVYVYRNYKLKYITILRFLPNETDPVTNEVYKKVTYVPSVNGFRLHNRGNHYCNTTVYKFDTLQEAKDGAMKQIDKDIESAKNFKYVYSKD